MAKNIPFSITPQGGEIDKYEVRLYDNTGLTPLDLKTFTTPFGSTLTGTFNSVADNTNYNIGVRVYIGSNYKDCPLKPISTTAPVVYITGLIQGVIGAVKISNLSQTIPCDVTFNIYGMMNNGGGDTSFSVPVTVIAGALVGQAPSGGTVVTSIAPTTSGGTTVVANTICGGVNYIYTLSINGAASPFLFKYGVTEADTTGSPLTEAQYITSVDDVFTSGTELSGIADNSGANVVVDSFGNGSTDKVCFVQVDGSIAAFTKWSEVGNPFQQNLPIDQSFGTGSNVWFKSTRAGQIIYITRSQTSFVGSVIFSR